MKIISIHQPAYLPWLGYFHKIMLSDIFVYLDTVQFEKNSFTNRNKILSNSGPLWLTVPVLTRGHTESTIRDLKISGEQWKRKHIQSIKMNYSKAPFSAEYYPDLEKQILNAGESFSDFVYGLTEHFCRLLGITSQLVRASSFSPQGEKSKLVENICGKFKADIYVSGTLGKDYLNRESFSCAGVRIYFQDYRHPRYKQLFREFVPGMSIIDALMNIGAEKTRDLIMSGNITRKDLEEVYAA